MKRVWLAFFYLLLMIPGAYATRSLELELLNTNSCENAETKYKCKISDDETDKPTLIWRVYDSDRNNLGETKLTSEMSMKSLIINKRFLINVFRQDPPNSILTLFLTKSFNGSIIECQNARTLESESRIATIQDQTQPPYSPYNISLTDRAAPLQLEWRHNVTHCLRHYKISFANSIVNHLAFGTFITILERFFPIVAGNYSVIITAVSTTNLTADSEPFLFELTTPHPPVVNANTWPLNSTHFIGSVSWQVDNQVKPSIEKVYIQVGQHTEKVDLSPPQFNITVQNNFQVLPIKVWFANRLGNSTYSSVTLKHSHLQEGLNLNEMIRALAPVFVALIVGGFAIWRMNPL